MQLATPPRAQIAALELRAIDTPLDHASGLAGGFGFTGGEGRVQESTVTVIEQLLEATQ